MSEELNQGFKVKTIDGKSVTVQKLLGSGGQGDVYLVDYDGSPMALKWYKSTAINSNYSNPKDDFNFNRERFRDLKTDAECEGLAQALARMTYSKMKKRYPPNSMEINIDHMDAKVTMHFQGANKNFVPAKDIL